MAELVWAINSGILAVACLIISIMQFKEKRISFQQCLYLGI